MKRILFLFLLVFSINCVFPQAMPAKTTAKYNLLKTDLEKGQFLDSYFGKAVIANKAKISNALELISWFKKNNDEVGSDYSQLFVANALIFKSDYSTSLNMALSVLPNFEDREDKNGMMLANNIIGLA